MKQLSPALSWAVPVQALLPSEFTAALLGRVSNFKLQAVVFMMCQAVVKMMVFICYSDLCGGINVP